MVKECVGDHFNVKCPHCGKTNHYVDQGASVIIPETGTVMFSHPCHHCKAMVYYRAWHYKEKSGFTGIKMHAYSENPE